MEAFVFMLLVLQKQERKGKKRKEEKEEREDLRVKEKQRKKEEKASTGDQSSREMRAYFKLCFVLLLAGSAQLTFMAFQFTRINPKVLSHFRLN